MEGTMPDQIAHPDLSLLFVVEDSPALGRADRIFKSGNRQTGRDPALLVDIFAGPGLERHLLDQSFDEVADDHPVPFCSSWMSASCSVMASAVSRLLG
jgi:hypothetical protein